jgi:hypothetical protein
MRGFHIKVQLRTSQGKIKKEQLTASQGTAYCFTRKNTILKKVFSLSYDLAPPTPLPPYSDSKLDRRHKGRLRKRDNMLTGEGEGVGEEPNHTTARKPSPL